VFEVIRAIRNLRAEVKITPGAEIPCVWLNPIVPEGSARLLPHQAMIAHLAWCREVRWGIPTARALMNPTSRTEVYLPIEGIIDIERERERLQREIAKAEEELRRVQVRLRNPQFLERARPEVVQETRQQEQELMERYTRLKTRLEQLQ
jgi:valyl-tRNA synthetase